MSSKIDICNLALSHLGMKGITSITEDTPSAEALNNFFNPCRDDVFREYRWPFATARQALVATTNTVLGWDYAYVYPVKAATIWYVFDEATVETKGEQEFEVIYVPPTVNARVVCSNLATAYAEYTYLVEDTTMFDPKFVMALSYRLAASLSHTLIGDGDKGLKLLEVYGNVLSEAKRTSYSERIKKPVQTSSSANSRA